MSRTIVYVDALNLYYQALKWSGNKWLNIEALASAVLPSHCHVVAINYYVADVSGRVDADAPRRQSAILRAMKSTPIVRIHKGNFLSNDIWTGMIHPLQFRPAPIIHIHWPRPIVGRVHKTEEKGSDVNLGAHLVRDAFQGEFETAAVLTNDTDLKEPIRIVIQELGLPVILLTPVDNPAKSLRTLASQVRHVRPYLGPCQFPNPVILPGGAQVHRPKSWAEPPGPRKKRKSEILNWIIRHENKAAAISTAGAANSFWLYEVPWYFAGAAAFTTSALALFLTIALCGFCRHLRGH